MSTIVSTNYSTAKPAIGSAHGYSQLATHCAAKQAPLRPAVDSAIFPAIFPAIVAAEQAA